MIFLILFNSFPCRLIKRFIVNIPCICYKCYFKFFTATTTASTNRNENTTSEAKSFFIFNFPPSINYSFILTFFLKNESDYIYYSRFFIKYTKKDIYLDVLFLISANVNFTWLRANLWSNNTVCF